MDKILIFSLSYAIVAIIFMWYAGISPAIANYVGKKLLNTEKKIIITFCVIVFPLIISALTDKIFASYSISMMLLLLYLELKNNNYGRS